MAFQYGIIFLLKEHIVFALTSSFTRSLSEIYSSFDILLILKEMKYQETNCKVCYDALYLISSLYRFQQLNLSGLHCTSY